MRGLNGESLRVEETRRSREMETNCERRLKLRFCPSEEYACSVLDCLCVVAFAPS
jgi:hypothetical protein